eukprot:CAMPEP_0167803294 /NCGR_PEP_ID=MMETSP0111_2-20121227/19716_1 /TAXON_ID=91324 /ORGANISM="Lotharella globosa, Strain CCCM811" /LENGTH=44 /DNA_ID= /DNA_START= /DNA_END= /DNA_ORIENTATION=
MVSESKFAAALQRPQKPAMPGAEKESLQLCSILQRPKKQMCPSH